MYAEGGMRLIRAKAIEFARRLQKPCVVLRDRMTLSDAGGALGVDSVSVGPSESPMGARQMWTLRDAGMGH